MSVFLRIFHDTRGRFRFIRPPLYHLFLAGSVMDTFADLYVTCGNLVVQIAQLFKILIAHIVDIRTLLRLMVQLIIVSLSLGLYKVFYLVHSIFARH